MTRRTRLVLVRHGESEWNAARILQGHGGPGLTARGVAQAAATARFVADVHAEAVAIWRSDLARVAETAAPAEGALPRVPVVVDERLRELDLGSWTGLSRHEAAAADPAAFSAWTRGDHDAPAGGAETFGELRARVAGVLSDMAAAALDRATGGVRSTVLVFTHGGPVRVGVAAALRLPVGGHRCFAPVANCAVSVLDVAPPGRLGDSDALLGAYNRTGHLEREGTSGHTMAPSDDEAYA